MIDEIRELTEENTSGDETQELNTETTDAQTDTTDAQADTTETQAETAGTRTETNARTGEDSVRQALEAAREAESRAYHNMSRATALTSRQKGVMELAKLEELETADNAILDKKCKLILESYYLPHILKTGFTVKLDKEFTRFDEPEKDYIEAVFTSPSGKEIRTAYNYKPDEDGKSLVLFEKSFENVIIKPGDPEKYVLYAPDGVTEIEALSTEELKQRILKGEVVKVEDEYFQKAKDENGELRPGTTTQIVEEESSNVKVIIGNNEQEKYSFSKTDQLVCAVSNDVTTVTLENRKLTGSGPIYDTADAARAAAQQELRDGESNLRVDVVMEGTTVAEFNYIPAFTTSIELTGMARKLGKGIEGYDPNESDEENLRRQFAKPITEYLVEKGFYVVDITCEKIEADIKENVGFMNTIKTYHMTGGTVSVTYIKKAKSMVTLKQGFRGRGQTNDPAVILAQLPEGSELLDPQDIDWKSSKLEVAYVVRGNVTGTGSAKTIPEADAKAAENAVIEAQKIVGRGINGGIASGIRETIAGTGAVSTVASVRARLTSPSVSKDDMQLTHKDAKYAYSGSCDRMNSTVESKLVAVTTWNGNKLTYVEPTDPIVERGIPTDDNYDKYINEGDDLGILLFERTDRGLHRYMDEVLNAQKEAKTYRQIYEKARIMLSDAQIAFDQMMDERFRQMDQEDETEESEVESVEETETEPAVEEIQEIQEIQPLWEAPVMTEDTVSEDSAAEDTFEEMQEIQEIQEIQPIWEAPAMTEDTVSENAVEETETVVQREMTAREALEAIFGDVSSEPTEAAEPLESTESLTEEAAAAEPQPQAPIDLQSDEDVDAAFERLLMGMPKE
ncbi:MAG: hypothetical protein NC092_08655 [Butyrivibrio sp.]|nr:hypothetical protein [Muribaculum sp.]MCM1552746.1 hypothetical protein [Butyrivibrio sp.]